MVVKPLKSYKRPAYPEKGHVLRNPNILKTIPDRWIGNIRVNAALSSVLVLMLAGCGQKTAGNEELTGPAGSLAANGSTVQTQGTVKPEETKIVPDGPKIPLDESELVAPVFRHGGGRGSFGCVSVAPPSFLSEAEAFEVISEEAAKEGISFEAGGLELENVGIPATLLYSDGQKENDTKFDLKDGTLKADGYDKNRKIAFEFVSKDDVVKWQGKSEIISTVETYDALGSAEGLGEGLHLKTDGNVMGLFYDPMGFDEKLYDKYSAQWSALAEDKKLTEDERIIKSQQIQIKYEEEIKEGRVAKLREQVKDFLQWCKAQGII